MAHVLLSFAVLSAYTDYLFLPFILSFILFFPPLLSLLATPGGGRGYVSLLATPSISRGVSWLRLCKESRSTSALLGWQQATLFDWTAEFCFVLFLCFPRSSLAASAHHNWTDDLHASGLSRGSCMQPSDGRTGSYLLFVLACLLPLGLVVSRCEDEDEDEGLFAHRGPGFRPFRPFICSVRAACVWLRGVAGDR
ncbi:hypothetical protein BD289DRAFT_265393 [Coniella lustricola]|uniref:Uncharacterized protein n=1 Tax=Coniella lustricola TaxID=2025994 RepID=A0A2T3A7G5_9PEZI|nr:hypothetical protein BD289DRAFT_265393 [Coniella lustricola]